MHPRSSDASVHRDAIADLPWALTFFLSADERRRVLRALRRLHTDRSRALLLALGINEPPTSSTPSEEGGAR